MATAIVGILVLVALFFALKGVVKHWRGESSCCGGGDVKVPKKKLTGTIVETKIVDIEGMTCGHCKARVEQALDTIDGARSATTRSAARSPAVATRSRASTSRAEQARKSRIPRLGMRLFAYNDKLRQEFVFFVRLCVTHGKVASRYWPIFSPIDFLAR